MKHGSTADEKRYMTKVQALGCCVCAMLGHEDTPALIHHVHVNFGWGRTSHYDILPLCNFHHVHPGASVHGMGRDEFAVMFGISEIELLDIVKTKLA